jgi:hypothetical protein
MHANLCIPRHGHHHRTLRRVLRFRHCQQPEKPLQDDDVRHLRPALHLPPTALGHTEQSTTKAGSALLVDGWYGFCRKPHYLADWVMATCWGLACGFDSPLPYLYSAFFAVMIIHRTLRDEHRCSQKYGDDWTAYKQRVPYVYFPGII